MKSAFIQTKDKAEHSVDVPESSAEEYACLLYPSIPEAFDENHSSWADEFIELYTALSPDEYESARASTLTAFYTPPVVISSIYKAMEQMGFKEGNILEPSCGIGNFIGMLPHSMHISTTCYRYHGSKFSIA